jgi:hypothetical protein
MSPVHRSNDPPERPAARYPDCPHCKEPMRLLRIQPHPRFVNLDERFFACTCGEEVSDLLARQD